MADDSAGDQPPQSQPGWQSPSGGTEPPPAAQPAQPPTQYGAPQYGPPQYGQPQYGQPQYGAPQYEQPAPTGFPGYAPPPGYQPPPGYGQPPGSGPPPAYGQAPPLPSWGPAFADKPGVIPLRPLAVGEILDGVFSTIRQNPKALLGLSFLLVLIGQLVVLAINLSFHDAGDGTRILTLFVGYLIQSLTATIATGVAVIVISEAVLGTRISASEVLNRLRGRIWRLFGLSLLVTLLTVLANVAFIYVMVLLSFSTSVFVLEKTTVGAALSRSAQLVRGNWWRTFGLGLLGYLVGLVIAGIIELPFTIGAGLTSGVFSTTSNGDISTGAQLLISLGGVIGGTLSTPIIAGTLALIYIDRRIRREGLDLVLVQTARERQGRS
jgi:hypothetical protein